MPCSSTSFRATLKGDAKVCTPISVTRLLSPGSSKWMCCIPVPLPGRYRTHMFMDWNSKHDQKFILHWQLQHLSPKSNSTKIINLQPRWCLAARNSLASRISEIIVPWIAHPCCAVLSRPGQLERTLDVGDHGGAVQQGAIMAPTIRLYSGETLFYGIQIRAVRWKKFHSHALRVAIPSKEVVVRLVDASVVQDYNTPRTREWVAVGEDDGVGKMHQRVEVPILCVCLHPNQAPLVDGCKAVNANIPRLGVPHVGPKPPARKEVMSKALHARQGLVLSSFETLQHMKFGIHWRVKSCQSTG